MLVLTLFGCHRVIQLTDINRSTRVPLFSSLGNAAAFSAWMGPVRSRGSSRHEVLVLLLVFYKSKYCGFNSPPPPSSIADMASLKPFTGPLRKLVLAFDVGTTYSGIAYAILDPGETPRIQGVTRKVNSQPYRSIF